MPKAETSAHPKTAVEELGSSAHDNRLLEQIQNSTFDAIIGFDDCGKISGWNARAQELFQWTQTEVTGRLIHELVPSQQLIDRLTAENGDSVEAIQENNLAAPLESVAIRKDGQERTIELRISAIKIEQGRSYIAVIRDISERLETQHQLKCTQDKLAHVARLCMLGELVAGVAHELNQPLTSISNHALIAQRTKDPAELNRSILDIQHQSTRAGEIVRSFRRLAALSEPIRVDCDMNELVQETVVLMKHDLTSNGVELELRCSPGLPHVRVDRTQIQQVLVNLFRNSLDAVSQRSTDHRKIVIETTSDEHSVKISVEDSGTLVEPETVFEPFVTTKCGGLGMGLAICQTIIEGHQGRLWLDQSSQDKNTRFCFRLLINPSSPFE